MSEAAGRAILETVYQRLSDRIETKPIGTEQLKKAALDALSHARALIEHDPQWVTEQLAQMQDEHVRPLPPHPDETS